MTDAPFNPSFALKPVWLDDDYLFSGKQAIYKEKWETVSVDRADTMMADCPRVSHNVFGARFGYKGIRLIEGREHPRLAVCINRDRSEAWADVNAFA